MKSAKLLHHYCIDDPAGFRLANLDCADTGGLDKDAASSMLADDVKRLSDLQERLYAQEHWAVLIVLQGMDAAGKDSVVAHVMSGVNPQGCDVHSFKAPSAEELDRDFLWRANMRLPARGRIGIFDRSYYEDVLVVRVHPEILQRQKLPAALIGEQIWEERFQDIRAFEHHLARSGILVLKFFLHVSKEEQKKRFLERLDDPAKYWKFSATDLAERAHWDDYMAAYEEALTATSTAWAPWYVVPADHKYTLRALAGGIVVHTIDEMDLPAPQVAPDDMAALARAKAELLAE